MKRILMLMIFMSFSAQLWAVTIVESITSETTYNEMTGDYDPVWNISVSDAEGVMGFLVGNNDASSAWMGYDDNILRSMGWYGRRVTRWEWESYYNAEMDSLAVEYGLATLGEAFPDGPSAGETWWSVIFGVEQPVAPSWDELMGTEYDQAVWYSTTYAIDDPTYGVEAGALQAGTTYDNFYFASSAAASPFAAFQFDPQSGYEIHSLGETTHGTVGVPEPSSLVLMLLGIAGFRFIERRRSILTMK